MTLLSLIPITLQTSIFLLVLSIGLTATLQDATLMFRNPGSKSSAIRQAAMSINIFSGRRRIATVVGVILTALTTGARG